jgi:phosphatidylglycerol:prolipoprotein diacylglycerol transferase
MIPFIHVPSWKLGPLTLHPFGLLVATAVLVGTWLATRRAKKLGLDPDELRSFVTWMLVGGFVGGHVIDALLYRPEDALARPWRLLELWASQGSFGGFIGALIGAVLWKYFEAVPWKPTPLFTVSAFRRRASPESLLPLADLVLSVFPVAWIFGRGGCAVAHDHPGIAAEPGTWLAVASGRYQSAEVTHLPLGIEIRYGSSPQYDLGTLELLFTIVLAAFVAATWRRSLPTGWYVAAVSLAYAPMRFAMDFLRIRDAPSADARYASLTPAQWACIALFVFGLFMVTKIRAAARPEPALATIALNRS